MKVTLSEINKNLEGTNSEGEEAGIQVNDLEHKGEISIRPEQQKEIIIKKRDSIRILWEFSKSTNIQIIGVPEGEEGDEETENLFEK